MSWSRPLILTGQSCFLRLPATPPCKAEMLQWGKSPQHTRKSGTANASFSTAKVLTLDAPYNYLGGRGLLKFPKLKLQQTSEIRIPGAGSRHPCCLKLSNWLQCVASIKNHCLKPTSFDELVANGFSNECKVFAAELYFSLTCVIYILTIFCRTWSLLLILFDSTQFHKYWVHMMCRAPC